jgi:hypothetical protein
MSLISQLAVQDSHHTHPASLSDTQDIIFSPHSSNSCPRWPPHMGLPKLQYICNWSTRLYPHTSVGPIFKVTLNFILNRVMNMQQSHRACTAACRKSRPPRWLWECGCADACNNSCLN